MRLQIKSGQYTVYYMQYRSIAFQTQPKITKSKMNSQIIKKQKSLHIKKVEEQCCAVKVSSYIHRF